MSDDPSTPEIRITPPSEKLRANLRYVFFSVVGSLFLGITLPVLLVSWNKSTEIVVDSERVTRLAQSAISLELTATIFCGPGAIILSTLLFKFLSVNKASYGTEDMMRTGMLGGAAMSFFNFPGLFVGVLFRDSGGMILLRVILLFSVAGATCGAWTGWQVYRSVHRSAPFWPRYRLTTLLGFVFAWAVLLAIFAPSSHS